MDTNPFEISYEHHSVIENATIHPCCNENNIVDYAVWHDGRLSFTITTDHANPSQWKIALKNADDSFDEELIQNIGLAIQQHKSI